MHNTSTAKTWFALFIVVGNKLNHKDSFRLNNFWEQLNQREKKTFISLSAIVRKSLRGIALYKSYYYDIMIIMIITIIMMMMMMMISIISIIIIYAAIQALQSINLDLP